MATPGRKLQTVRLTTPVSPEAIAGLELGQVVYLDGVVYTGREGVYQRIVGEGQAPPVDLAGLSNVNFHCSPAAAVEPDGSTTVRAVTATASFRFAKWLPKWFEISGCKVIIGKGGMTEKHYREIFVPVGAVYLTTVGYGRAPGPGHQAGQGRPLARRAGHRPGHVGVRGGELRPLPGGKRS
jgi:L(+)-tartrate dehydratase beta subunit